MSNNKIHIEIDMEARLTPQVIRIVDGIAKVLRDTASDPNTFQQTIPSTAPAGPGPLSKEQGRPSRSNKQKMAKDDDAEDAKQKAAEAEKVRQAKEAKKRKDAEKKLAEKATANFQKGKTPKAEPKPEEDLKTETEEEQTLDVDFEKAKEQDVVGAEEISPKEELEEPTLEENKLEKKPKKIYSLEDLQKLTVQKARAGHRVAIKEKFMELDNAQNATSLDKAKYAEMMDFLHKLPS